MKIILVLLIFILSFFSFVSKTNPGSIKPPVKNTSLDAKITLITTGDVIPARTVNWKMTKLNDFTYPFAKTYEFLKNSDLTLINLEAPLVKDCPITTEGMVFCGDQRFIQGLLFAGIDVVNLANNHSYNWGELGLVQTQELLKKNNILAAGFPLPLVTKKIKNTNFGFLGWNILDNPNQKEIMTQIKSAKEAGVDFLIVSFHWGAEYQRFPSKETMTLAHHAINNGADLIVGNHPHWYQPIEIHKDKPIIYSHGNFIFDQEWSQETKTGFLTKLVIYQSKVIDLQIFPIFITDYSQSYFLEGFEKQKVLEDLQNISKALPTK